MQNAALHTHDCFLIGLDAENLDIERAGIIVATGLHFSLRPGDALVLRGDNGTGKTSALRTIAGFTPAPKGHLKFLDGAKTLDADEARAMHLHWLGGEDGLADRMSAAETLKFWHSLLGHQANELCVPAILAAVALPDIAQRAVGRLSTGQRRRLGMARLLTAPRAVWLLDEPLSGLDQGGRELLLSLISAHRTNGGIVIMATHEDGLPNAPNLRLAPMSTATTTGNAA